MKAIKCKISNAINVSEYLRKYNSILRISYNRFKIGISQSNIKKEINTKFEGLNSFIIQNAITQAQGLLKAHNNKKKAYESLDKNANVKRKYKEILFGGRHNLKQYLNGRISKEEYKLRRLSSMIIAGETRHRGNRLFNLDVENNIVTFKPKKGIKIPIKFICSRKQKEELLTIQKRCLKNEFSVAISFDNNSLIFIFDEQKLNENTKFYANLKYNRIIGIDQNPNYLGVCILEFDHKDNFKILYKRVFALNELTKKSGKDSSHAASKHVVDKRRFETLNLAYEIDVLAKAWHAGKIALEDLHFKSSFSRHESNRLCKNSWNRLLFENKLKMLTKEHGIQVVEINPAYTSQIGNVLYGNNATPDMVAASIEIARRAYKKFQKGWFYPDFNRSLSLIDEQWKQTLSSNSVKSWNELFTFIKESEIKYRIPLDMCKPSRVLRLNSKKSFISLLEYDII